MENKLKRVKLSDLGKIITGKTPSTKDQDNFGDKCFFITPRDIFGQRTITFTERKLSETGKTKLRNYLIPAQSICVTCIGSDMGKVVMTTGESITNQQINSIIPNDTVVNPYYLYYCLKPMKEYLKSIAGGTTMPILNKSDFSGLMMDLPLLESQNKIVEILSSLDDKIELNNEMNKTLEEMAQAIFKSWFVDFEPFKDGEFEESELGMIPKGWKVSTIGDEFSIVGGGTPKTKVEEYWNSDDILWATPTDLTTQNISVIDSTSKYISEEGLKNSSAKLLPKETIIMTSRATIGYCAITKKELSTNQGFINIVCDKYLSNGFMLYWIKINLEKIINLANGSTFKEISKGTFKGIKIIVPDKEMLLKYNNIINEFIDRIYNIKKQNDFLKNIRDTLLPKLISGEIRLNDLQ